MTNCKVWRVIYKYQKMIRIKNGRLKIRGSNRMKLEGEGLNRSTKKEPKITIRRNYGPKCT